MNYTKARQDIFIAGYESADDTDKSAASLVIDGAIGSGAGTIWVWAAELPHYKSLCQFAKYTSDVTQLENTLKAFRNAWPDSETGAAEQYLYGVAREDDPDGNNVFWYGVEGSRRVILRKVDGSFSPFSATFAIHRGTVDGAKVSGTDVEGNENVDTFPSENSGVFFIGDLSYGTYVIEETSGPGAGRTFVISVDKEGVGYLKDGAYSHEIKPAQ